MYEMYEMYLGKTDQSFCSLVIYILFLRTHSMDTVTIILPSEIALRVNVAIVELQSTI